jgi:hypothetical protein
VEEDAWERRERIRPEEENERLEKEEVDAFKRIRLQSKQRELRHNQGVLPEMNNHDGGYPTWR